MLPATLPALHHVAALGAQTNQLVAHLQATTRHDTCSVTPHPYTLYTVLDLLQQHLHVHVHLQVHVHVIRYESDTARLYTSGER